MTLLTQNKRNQSRVILAKVLAAASIDHPILSASVEAFGLEELVAAALKRGMGGLFLQASTNLPLALSSDQEGRLRRQATRTAVDNLNTLRAFKRVARKLLAADLPFFLLKGAALILNTYHRFDLRPMTDIDLLIRPVDAERADRILRDYGCLPGRSLVREDFFPRYYYAAEYYADKPFPFRIDLHAHPFRPLRYRQTMPEDALWDHASQLELEDIKLSCLCDVNMLIYLATHSAIHGNQRLFWLYDIFRFVQTRRDSIDWELLRRKVADWRLTLPVRKALHQTAVLFDDLELQAVSEQIGDRAGWRDKLVLLQAPRDIAHPIAHIVTNLLTTRGIRFRVGYMKAMLLPDASHMQEVYPFRHVGWLFVAHLWRFVRAVIRPLRSLARAWPFNLRRTLLKVETAPGSG